MHQRSPDEPARSPVPGIIPDPPAVHDRPQVWRGGRKTRDGADAARARQRNRPGAGSPTVHRAPPAASRPKGR
ncbi:MAG: hypothetical protein QOE86_3985 [Solirubrobacteraceae bacterium]|jgi:hypothetical protein|nr:hypothetical protein [Solirubrobacteraceae bacterium]